MTESINFPNLGIHLEHVGQKISIFGFDIAYYGMILYSCKITQHASLNIRKIYFPNLNLKEPSRFYKSKS